MGLGVVRLLKQQAIPLVAFVTAHDEYAVRAFELNAVDYLLKPVDRQRLRRTLDRARTRLEDADGEDAVRPHETTRTAAERPPRRMRRPRHARRARHARPRAMPRGRLRICGGFRFASGTTSCSSQSSNWPRSSPAGSCCTSRPLRINASRSRTACAIWRRAWTRRSSSRLSRGTLANLRLIQRVSPMPGATYMVTLSTGHQLAVSRLQARALRDHLLRL